MIENDPHDPALLHRTDDEQREYVRDRIERFAQLAAKLRPIYAPRQSAEALPRPEDDTDDQAFL